MVAATGPAGETVDGAGVVATRAGARVGIDVSVNVAGGSGVASGLPQAASPRISARVQSQSKIDRMSRLYQRDRPLTWRRNPPTTATWTSCGVSTLAAFAPDPVEIT